MCCKKSGGLLLCNDRSGAETTGSFSAHAATHSINGSAHEHLTQTMFFSVFAKQAGYVTIKTTSKMKEIRRINHVLWKLWETIK